MPRRQTPDDPAMTTDEAARYLGLSRSTLEKARVYRRGPKFVKYEKAVRYLLDDLRAYRDGRRRDDTGPRTD